MIIDGFQKLTLLDYPGKLACIIFTKGCNLKCPFCQNSSLISCKQKKGKISEEEIFLYLEKRKKLLDGLVITGGEPLIQKNIKSFIKRVKDLGLLVKLDTNGCNPTLLKELIDEHLVDYVAMDIKNIYPKYNITSGSSVPIEKIEASINILKDNLVPYEFRTTIIKELHTTADIEHICKLVGDSKYYLQNFEDSSEVINHNLHGFSHDELLIIDSTLKSKFPNMEIRALT